MRNFVWRRKFEYNKSSMQIYFQYRNNKTQFLKTDIFFKQAERNYLYEHIYIKIMAKVIIFIRFKLLFENDNLNQRIFLFIWRYLCLDSFFIGKYIYLIKSYYIF